MKNKMACLLLIVCFAFLSCETLEKNLDNLFSSLQKGATGSANTAKGSNYVATPVPKKGTGTETRKAIPRVSKEYVLPASYETAYSCRTGTPDQNMKNIPKNLEGIRTSDPAEYVRQVAELINNSAKNDFEKAKKAHDIVALLVKYDAANFWTGTIPDQSYQSVLRNRLAVCEGYANTFKKFCDELKIPCEVVHGFGRGVGTSPLAGDTPNDSNHAWNIVTINGESYLVDCTWDSGFMDGKISKQQYSTDWLFLKPDHFLYTHYPENTKQQLLAQPLTAAQFSALPFFKPKFFELADNISIKLKKINQVDNNLSFHYTIKDGYQLDFSINDIKTGREIPNRNFVQTDGTKETVFFSFPSAGQYSINIFWWKTGSKQGEGCGEFVVESFSENSVQYPTIYSSSAKNLQIINPVEMPLKKGSICEFKIGVDNKKVVAIIHGSTFVPLTKNQNNIFTGDFEIPDNIKDLSVGVADSERGRYEIIAKYSVE
jgi:hypothetical protein